jgi:hypothetical protein
MDTKIITVFSRLSMLIKWNGPTNNLKNMDDLRYFMIYSFDKYVASYT